jgi:hypothetical protein
VASLTVPENDNVNDAVIGFVSCFVRDPFDSMSDPRKDDHNQNEFPHL